MSIPIPAQPPAPNIDTPSLPPNDPPYPEQEPPVPEPGPIGDPPCEEEPRKVRNE